MIRIIIIAMCLYKMRYTHAVCMITGCLDGLSQDPEKIYIYDKFKLKRRKTLR